VRALLLTLAALILLLAAALWYLGRDSALQTIARKVSEASNGSLVISGANGSLYGKMHINQLRYRSPTQNITADNIDLDWSPFQYLTSGLIINKAQVATLVVESMGPSSPTVLPESIAAPFNLHVADARLGKLTLKSATGSNEIDNIRLKLDGGKTEWRLQNASALTVAGLVTADATIGTARPFPLTAKATLAQSAPPAGQKPAQLALTAGGSLQLLNLNAVGTSENANGDAKLTLAPFDAIILRAADINGRDIDPSRFDPTWPQANLRVALKANIDPKQALSGALDVTNTGLVGPLDQQRLPLKSITAKLGGTLTASTIDDVLIDLAEAGRFTGSGAIARSAPDAGIGNATFKLHTDRIDLKQIQGTLKATKIAGDIGLASTATTQTLTALLADAGLKLDIQATLADQLVKIQRARLLAGKGSIDITGEASLKDEQAFKATASASHFNPAAFGDYPSADLNADIHASGKVTPAWQVVADFALRPSRLFDQPLSGSGKLTADATHISDVATKLALGNNTVDLKGAFGAAGETLNWSVNAPQLSAARSDLVGSLVANGVVSGTMDAPRSSFSADAKGLGLVTKGAKRPPADSLLHATGDIGLTGPKKQLELQVKGTAQRLNPATFGAYPSGNIGADFDASARLTSDWRVAVNLALQPSTLGAAPLTGYAKVVADAVHVEKADVDLHLGPNSITAGGAFGSGRDQLNWKIDAPQLSSLGAQFAGVINGSGVLSGTADAPSLSLKLDGKKLRLFNTNEIDAVTASANLGSGKGAADPLVMDLHISGFGSPSFGLADARLTSSGTRAAHTLQLSGRNADFDASAQIKGGWNAGAWSGTLDALQNKGRFAVTLQAPVPVRIAGPANSGVAGLLAPEQISLSNMQLKLPGGSVTIQNVSKNGPRWASSGQAAGVPLTYLAQVSQAWRENARSDLTLGAQWSLNVQAATSPGAAPVMAGNVHVYREKGDVTVGTDTPLALGLRTLDTKLDILNNTLKLQVQLDGQRVGQANVTASVQMAQGRIATDSGLSLTGKADMASLAWLAPLTGQPGLELDGRLKLDVTGAGTIGQPTLTGDISGSKLLVNWAEQGIKLNNGQLLATLAGDQLQLKTFSFDGTEGKLGMDGWVRFADAEPTMQLKLVADKLMVLSRPDRRLVLSGDSTLVRDSSRFQLTGKFRADRATIELASQNTPTLSNDVVVLGRNKDGTVIKPGTAAKPASGDKAALPLNIDLQADLGNRFKLSGKGLDAMLTGSVRVRIEGNRPPAVNGSINVASGTYAAYGQKLSIERGVLNFTGAYDNPGLNIQAVRKRPEGEQLSETNVEAGVEVRGRAQAPTARLISTPSVPDSEKLAWLVLGHGTEGTASDEMGLLTTAAGAIFGGTGGGVQDRIANSLGLDEVGLGQSSNSSSTTNGQAKGLESTVLTVGKRLSQRAYISFEQGTGTATSLVKLKYKLNRRFTLQLQTGVNSAVDVLYSWAFD
jgi:translocation and assembly module TamB